MTEAKELLIQGRVQGVSFRYYASREALKLGLRGTVRNLPGGSVHIQVEGEPAALEVFMAWCRHGPPLARVDEVIITDVEPGAFSDFIILR